MIREGDIGEKLFPDFPDMKVDFSEIGIGKIGKIGLAPPPPRLRLKQGSRMRTRFTSYLFFSARPSKEKREKFVSTVDYLLYFHNASDCIFRNRYRYSSLAEKTGGPSQKTILLGSEVCYVSTSGT